MNYFLQLRTSFSKIKTKILFWNGQIPVWILFIMIQVTLKNKFYTQLFIQMRQHHIFIVLYHLLKNQIKKRTTSEIKDYYDNKDFNSNDIYDISKGTTKEDELFDYAEIPSYMKSKKYSENYKDKDDYEMSL